jgi:hypothetical protein
VATQFKVYQGLIRSDQPIRSDHIFSRIAYAQFPASAAQRDMFQREIWSIIEETAHADPCIIVRNEVVARGGARPGKTWEWFDSNIDPTIQQANF